MLRGMRTVKELVVRTRESLFLNRHVNIYWIKVVERRNTLKFSTLNKNYDVYGYNTEDPDVDQKG